ncbi:hypothetical protein B0T26DRAFT_675786 [Lasiosphaeria miniovina]|uniref:Uncharacterized protein n=1 Tax=Lasiosphaeria miniovina TaxID=1954250 RepID=A0AA40AKE4_9PEZI|nr:uncharacterized protein B0T26DRAFT_675786 [Lasiosphaeria miniovina]KAK0717488.1 hypothetical protein B0T26DRAFT_675786 [Lasiosphaeria miniovina]
MAKAAASQQAEKRGDAASFHNEERGRSRIDEEEQNLEDDRHRGSEEARMADENAPEEDAREVPLKEDRWLKPFGRLHDDGSRDPNECQYMEYRWHRPKTEDFEDDK